MKVVIQKVGMEPVNTQKVMNKLKVIGRVCRRNEDKTAEDSCETFVRELIKSGHESVLEHVSITVIMKVNRAIAQEITRHRIGSYSHESTRYVKYNELEIIPSFDDEGAVQALELLEVVVRWYAGPGLEGRDRKGCAPPLSGIDSGSDIPTFDSGGTFSRFSTWEPQANPTPR